jgi:hypothetical protein
MRCEHTKELGEPTPSRPTRFAYTDMFRYERVKAVQKTGETTRDMWHKADWDKVKQNPESVQFPREDWIHMHDAENHAEDVFDEEFAAVKKGELFETVAVPVAAPAKMVSGGVVEKVGATAMVEEVSVAGEVEVNGSH